MLPIVEILDILLIMIVMVFLINYIVTNQMKQLILDIRRGHICWMLMVMVSMILSLEAVKKHHRCYGIKELIAAGCVTYLTPICCLLKLGAPFMILIFKLNPLPRILSPSRPRSSAWLIARVI